MTLLRLYEKGPRTLIFYHAMTYILYHHSYVYCLSCKVAQEAPKEAHYGTCESHQPRLRFWDYLH